MNREVHVRICEGLGVKFPRATRLGKLHWQDTVLQIPRERREAP